MPPLPCIALFHASRSTSPPAHHCVQVQVAANTDVMIGCHGNGLTHAMWMPPGSLLVELTDHHLQIDYQALAQCSNQRHFVFDVRTGLVAGVEDLRRCSNVRNWGVPTRGFVQEAPMHRMPELLHLIRHATAPTLQRNSTAPPPSRPEWPPWPLRCPQPTAHTRVLRRPASHASLGRLIGMVCALGGLGLCWWQWRRGCRGVRWTAPCHGTCSIARASS